MNLQNVIRTINAMTLAVVLLIGATVAGYAVNTPQSEPVMAAQPKIIIRTAVIRLGTTVYLHTNSAHGSVGITSINLSGGCDIVVSTDTQPGEKILSIDVDEDETMTRLGIAGGGSGGLGTTTIPLYNRSGSHICANNSIFGTNANIWLTITSEIG